eukprot:6413919-Pyramimonas_sp.AAC.1
MLKSLGVQLSDGADKAAQDFRDRWFAPLRDGETVEDRFGDVKGSRRWVLLQIIYGVRSLDRRAIGDGSYVKSKPVTHSLMLWGPDGTQLLKRAPANPRKQDAVVKAYAAGVLKDGVSSVCRGMMIALATDQPNHFEMLAGGTLTEACYLAERIARESDPEKVYIQQLREEGFSNVIVVLKARRRACVPPPGPRGHQGAPRGSRSLGRGLVNSKMARSKPWSR